MVAPVTVTSLHFYPIKSCRAVTLEQAFVGPRGLEVGRIGDRRWMLADAAGRMVTQRERPALARVTIALEADRLLVAGDDLAPIAFGPDETQEHRESILLHGQTVVGHLSLPSVNDWFSRFLGETVRLLYQRDDDIRLCDPNFALAPLADRLGFADAYPYLLTSLATLERLGTEIQFSVPMNRFRPNIVIGGSPADAEYGWRSIAIGAAARLALVKPCTRCVVTTIDQDSGARTGPEPLATLQRAYSLSAWFGRAQVRGAVFGENAIASQNGMIHRGDAVAVVEEGPRHTFGR